MCEKHPVSCKCHPDVGWPLTAWGQECLITKTQRELKMAQDDIANGLLVGFTVGFVSGAVVALLIISITPGAL